MCVAKFVAPSAAPRARTPNTFSSQGRGGKVEGLVALARRSGQSITSALQCVKCGLQFNLGHNSAYLEGVLTMPCVGTFLEHVLKHPWPSDEDCILMYNHIEAHSSHTMATSGSLKIHVCVACGSFGASRSTNLQVPCQPMATKAGKRGASGNF